MEPQVEQRAAFISPLQVIKEPGYVVSEELEDEADFFMWKLTQPLAFRSLVAGRVFVVPVGFLTDFASVPRLPLAYLLTGDTVHAPAVLHDWLIRERVVQRATADAIFLEAMEADGISWWRRKLMWLAVRSYTAVAAPTYDVAQ